MYLPRSYSTYVFNGSLLVSDFKITRVLTVVLEGGSVRRRLALGWLRCT